MPEMVDPTHTPAPGQGCQLRPGGPCPVSASAALDKGVSGAEMGELAGRGVRLPVGDSVLKPCAPRRWCRVGSGGGGGGVGREQGQPEPRPPVRGLCYKETRWRKMEILLPQCCT